jgi:hypothetical protein
MAMRNALRAYQHPAVAVRTALHPVGLGAARDSIAAASAAPAGAVHPSTSGSVPRSNIEW